MNDINQEITLLKSEKDTLNTRTERNIRDHKKTQEEEGKTKKTENQDNSFFFVIISTLIELVILFGVYFNEYFKFRSYTDFKQKIEKDENFQRWHIYNELLGVVFNEDTKMNDKLPSMKTIQEICKLNGLQFLNKDLISAFKLFGSLGILKTSGSSKYISKSKETSIEMLRKHFNID